LREHPRREGDHQAGRGRLSLPLGWQGQGWTLGDQLTRDQAIRKSRPIDFRPTGTSPWAFFVCQACCAIGEKLPHPCGAATATMVVPWFSALILSTACRLEEHSRAYPVSPEPLSEYPLVQRAQFLPGRALCDVPHQCHRRQSTLAGAGRWRLAGAVDL